MPKMKTHKGTAKRVKVTSTGKVVHEMGGKHYMEKKSSRQARRMTGTSEFSPAETKRAKKLLGR